MAIQLFFTLLVAGLVMFGAEIFVPGGILGILGALCLVIAMVTGFAAFPGQGALVALGILLLIGASFILWATLFPRSKIGRRLTMSANLASSKATSDDLRLLMGVEGLTDSALRPGGFAVLKGQRIDVITTGEMLDKGTRIKVVGVEGNRVVVAPVPTT